MRKPPEEAANIQFRLGGAALKALEKRAKAYGLSPGQFARRVLVEYLEDAERLWMRERLVTVELEQKRLREDLAVAVEALLVSTGEVNEEEAQAWVDANLRSV